MFSIQDGFGYGLTQQLDSIRCDGGRYHIRRVVGNFRREQLPVRFVVVVDFDDVFRSWASVFGHEVKDHRHVVGTHIISDVEVLNFGAQAV